LADRAATHYITTMTAAVERPADLEAAAFPPFRPRPPWLGADLQTLRNYLRGRPAELSSWPARRLELTLGDNSGDRLAAALHRPAEDRGRPLAVLIHGLTGCEESSYIRASARHLLTRGYPVLRLNLRGAGPSRPLCRLQYHAGRSEDLRDALRALGALDSRLTARGLVLAGYSLGANMLLKFLAEYAGDFPLRAAATVSAPIDLKATQERIMAPRNALYHRYLLARMKAESLHEAGGLGAGERRIVLATRSIYQFDDVVVAPRGGFAGAEDYYRRSSARRFLAAVGVPTLVIHAMDDPWIPGHLYRQVDWAANRRLVPLLPAAGGHVGFHGRGSRTTWHDHCIARFFAGLVD
jgi:predicted alpha/beta-fold hydrolase